MQLCKIQWAILFCILVCSYRSNTAISKIPGTADWKLCFSQPCSSEEGRFCGHSFGIVLYTLSRVLLFATWWTVARQAPLSVGILKARILGWAVISSARGASRPRDRTCVSFVSYRAGGFFTTEPPGKSSLALDNIKSITPAWQKLFPASNHMHTPGGPNVHQNSITSFGKEAERLPGLWSRNI